MLACADEIGHYMDGVDVAAFLADAMRQRAIERLLTIIGEAAKNLDPATRGAIDQPWREIIRLRDKGIHHYDSLAPASLHRIATLSVPELASAIRAYLDA